MKQKFPFLIATFLLLSFFSTSQSLTEQRPTPYFGKAGIKKKVSELLAVKPETVKPTDMDHIRALKFSLKKFQNFTKPGPGDNVSASQMEEDADVKALGSPSKVGSTATQQVWSNFLSIDFYDNPVGWPPDPSGDVGATRVIVASNLGFKVYDKPTVTDLPVITNTGYSREQARSTLFITLRQFFSPVLPQGTNIFDPHIRYDRLSKRWFIIAGGGRATKFNLSRRKRW